MNSATMLPIQGTFDIALARRTLRTKIATRRWPTSLNARATATLTALGELILLPCVVGLSVVQIALAEDGGPAGVEFNSALKLNASDSAPLAEAEARLARASDELNIQERPDGITITARIWLQ